MAQLARPLNILVVDDTADTRMLLRLMLETWGHRVEEAENGQEAIGLALTQKPDIILMDLAMPILDGFEATRQLRAQAEFAKKPILAISAHCHKNSEYVTRALGAGCDACLPKPIDPDMLASVIREYSPHA